MAESVLLRVAKAQTQAEVGLGRARLDMKTRKELGVEVGDAVEITGKKLTAAKVFRAQQEDEGKDIIRIDGMIRSNAGVSIGERVTVARADPQPASQSGPGAQDPQAASASPSGAGRGRAVPQEPHRPPPGQGGRVPDAQHRPGGNAGALQGLLHHAFGRGGRGGAHRDGGQVGEHRDQGHLFPFGHLR